MEYPLRGFSEEPQLPPKEQTTRDFSVFLHRKIQAWAEEQFLERSYFLYKFNGGEQAQVIRDSEGNAPLVAGEHSRMARSFASEFIDPEYNREPRRRTIIAPRIPTSYEGIKSIIRIEAPVGWNSFFQMIEMDSGRFQFLASDWKDEGVPYYFDSKDFGSTETIVEALQEPRLNEILNTIFGDFDYKELGLQDYRPRHPGENLLSKVYSIDALGEIPSAPLQAA